MRTVGGDFRLLRSSPLPLKTNTTLNLLPRSDCTTLNVSLVSPLTSVSVSPSTRYHLNVWPLAHSVSESVPCVAFSV